MVIIGRLTTATVALAWLASTACAVCNADSDCPTFGDTCVEGACGPAAAPTLEILSPRAGDVGEFFELIIDVGFKGGLGTVAVQRSIDSPGEPCLPFPAIQRAVVGDPDAFTHQLIVLPGVPSLGPTFGVQIRAEVNGLTLLANVDLEGPAVADDIGGFTMSAPRAADVDVVLDPLVTVVVDEALQDAVAFVEPRSGLTTSTTPRVSLPDTGDRRLEGRVPALRGEQIVWVEGRKNGVLRRCGRPLFGGPDDVDDGELEVFLITQSSAGDDHWVEVSTRISSNAAQTICDGRVATTVPCVGHVVSTPGPNGRDGLLIDLVDGLVEIAAVPRIVSGPVSAQVRISRGRQHVALFGPVVLQPQRGEAWVAGRVAITGGAVSATVAATAPPLPGLPW